MIAAPADTNDRRSECLPARFIIFCLLLFLKGGQCSGGRTVTGTAQQMPTTAHLNTLREGLTQERADPDERHLRSIAVLSLFRKR